MTRSQTAAILVRLVDKLRVQESWTGETHLQKAVFFLERMLSSRLSFVFILYKHGPFSFDLRDELTALRVDGILELEPQSPPYGPRFTATSVGKRLAENHPRTLQEQEERLEFVAQLFKGKGVKELERLATALYVSLESGWDSSIEGRAKFLSEVKPHVPIEEAMQAVSALDALHREANVRGLDRSPS